MDDDGRSSSLSSIPSSPLMSVGSRSPSLPRDYPSPLSSNISETGRSVHDTPDRDGPPPAKRLRLSKPKELKTEYLDLNTYNESLDKEYRNSEEKKLEKLSESLRLKKKIVVVAGAGISVSAGIPDFRSSTGLFNTLRTQHKLKSSGKHLFDASVYRSDSSTSSFHDMVRELAQQTQSASPTPFHHMLATIAEEGRLMRLYTQNVDGIDVGLEPLRTDVPLKSKGPWPKTIQLHGGLSKMVCSKCGDLRDFDSALFEGPEPPSCLECEEMEEVRMAAGCRGHGIGRLRPRMVLYNEYNPDEDAIGAVSSADLRSRPDAVIVVGTSLKIPGIRRLVKELCSVTRGRRGGFTAWVNYDPEPSGPEFKDCWDLVVKGESDDVARHVGLPKWDDKDFGAYSILKDEEVKLKQAGIEIVVDSKLSQVVKTEGLFTPGTSSREQTPLPTQPSSKTKQSQLPFATKTPTDTAAKPKKKPGRKPTVAKPKEKINKVFTASKASKPISSKATAPKVSPSSFKESACQSMFPNLPKTKPEVRIPSMDQYKQTSSQPLPLSSSPPRPRTPVQSSYERQETISPKSVPSGMENLIS